jgi:fluoride ion exporter CrcB/FEX
MTVAHVPGHAAAPTSDGHHPPGHLARWAVRLSAVFGTAFVASAAAVAIAYAVGVESAVDDTMLGVFLGIMAVTGFLGSLATFLAAIVAKVRRERWTHLWLPLCVFPALLALLGLVEAFWWE